MKIKWGAYIGALVFGVFAYSISTLCNIAGDCIFYRQAILVLTGACVGFLVGWGIHFLIEFLFRHKNP